MALLLRKKKKSGFRNWTHLTPASNQVREKILLKVFLGLIFVLSYQGRNCLNFGCLFSLFLLLPPKKRRRRKTAPFLRIHFEKLFKIQYFHSPSYSLSMVVQYIYSQRDLPFFPLPLPEKTPATPDFTALYWHKILEFHFSGKLLI